MSLLLKLSKKKEVTAYSDSFVRANGTLDLIDGLGDPSYRGGITKWWGNLQWSISGNRCIPNISLGPNLVTNPGMETGDPPSNWSPYHLVAAAETTIKHAGAQSLKATANDVNPVVYQTPVGTASGNWVLASGYVYPAAGSTAYFNPSNMTPAISRAYTAQTWAQRTITGRATGAIAVRMQLSAAGVGYLDDVNLQVLAFASSLQVVYFTQSDFIVGAGVITPVDTLAGVCACVDDYNNPQNCLLAYTDGENRIYFDQLLGGSWSNLWTAVYPADGTQCAYAADDVIEIRKSGSTFTVYYKGIQVKTSQTITDGRIVNNRYHGLFATSNVGVSFSSFCVRAYNRLPYADNYRQYFAGQTYANNQGIAILRFDDGLAATYSTVYPLLTARNLVAGIAVPRSSTSAALGYCSLAQVIEMQTAGMEIMCHSLTHGADPASTAAFLIESRDAIAEMRRLGLRVSSWVQPGTYVGASNTYNITTTGFYGTVEDATLRQYAACYMAYIASLWDVVEAAGNRLNLPLASKAYGFSVAAGDNQSLVYLENLVDLIVSEKRATTFVFHPHLIGTGGSNISLADFTTFLTYLQTKVTAGTLRVLTPTQAILAMAA